MPVNQILNKGDKIKSKRSGKVLECYHISTVYIGEGTEPVRLEYSFWDALEKKAQTMKEVELKKKLSSTWVVFGK